MKTTNTASSKIEKGFTGTRLDLYLSLTNNDLSRSAIKKLINEGQVTINSVVEFRPHYRVKEGDLVTITKYFTDKSVAIKPENIQLDIIYEDADLLVVNKGAGMTVHPATGNWNNTLMNAVLFYYQQMQLVGDTVRSGLIHRLDKDTSGVILVGKTNKGLWYYSRLFAERKVEKTYLAIIAGNIKQKIGTDWYQVKNYLGRNPKNRKKIAAVDPGKGRLAVTELRLIKEGKLEGQAVSLVEVKPKTGRTHQIRVHLANLGYPVLGDIIYGRANRFRRLLLHAWKLKLKLLEGKETEFTAAPDQTFVKLMA